MLLRKRESITVCQALSDWTIAEITTKLGHEPGYESENTVFFFCQASALFTEMAKCCQENL